MAKGLYRGVDWARVDYDDKLSIPIPRERYVEQDYKPPYDELPTKEQYQDLRYRSLLDQFTIPINHVGANVTEH